MENELRLTIFWIIHPILLGLFVCEFLFILSTWLKAQVPNLPPDASRWQKLWVAITRGTKIISSRRIWSFLKALVADGMIHRQLFRTNRRRWGAHLSVFGAWLSLAVLSTLTGFVTHILPLLGMDHQEIVAIPILGQLLHADVWWVALLNELLGLIALFGMTLILLRRYVQKDPQLRTTPADTLVIMLLTLIAISGFPAETFRLLADYTVATGAFVPDPSLLPATKLPLALYDAWGPQWAFIGYPLARLLGVLNFSRDAWTILQNISFWLHYVVAISLLFLMPFTRFFHIILSPVVAAYNSMLDRERVGTISTPVQLAKE